MRLAWLTPLGFGSGVSRFSLSVVRALNALDGIDVDVWHSPSPRDLECPWAPTYSLADASTAKLERYDNIIYNLGNHPGGHATIFEWSQRTSGIVILHDRVMQDFFFHHASEIRNDPMHYACLMGYVYGPAAAKLAADIVLLGQSPELWEEASTRFPLFEPCLFNARGAITHSRESAAQVNHRYPGLLPTIQLELPRFIYGTADDGMPPLTREDLSLPADKVLLVASGRFGPQKRLDVLIGALAEDTELRTRTLLVVAGGGDDTYLEHLRGLCEQLGLVDSVRFMVEPDDRTMQGVIGLADVAVNLRHPSTESASASLVEQLHFCKPVIVSRVGIYDELPDDVVVKVGLENEQAELGDALRRLILDVEFRAKTVSAVAAYAASHFSSDDYAQRLVAFVEGLATSGTLLDRADQGAAQLGSVPVSRLRARVDDSAAALAAGVADRT